MSMSRDDSSVNDVPADGRIYRLDSRTQMVLGALAALQAIVMVAWSGYIAVTIPRFELWMLSVMALSLLGASILLLIAFGTATVLYIDRIEARRPFENQSIRKDEIANYRLVLDRNGKSLVEIHPRDANRKVLRLGRDRADAAFDQWFDGIEETGAAEFEAAKSQLDETRTAVESHPVLGASTAERAVRMTHVRRVAVAFSVLAPVVMVWASLWPHPYALSIWVVSILPILGLAAVWWSKGVIQLIQSRRGPRPHLGLTLYAGLALLPRLSDNPSIGVWSSLIGAAVFGGAVFMGDWLLNPKDRGNGFASFLLISMSLIHGFMATTLLNRVADGAAVQVHQTLIVDKRVIQAKGTSYTLDIPPWGSEESPVVTFHVDPATFRRSDVGQRVCVAIHPGAFDMPWFGVQACPQSEHKLPPP